MLFYVRQKHQDLLTQLAVSIQGYLAIDIIIKNNIELIKGVDRASTTTISALRTAVIVAQALGNQKLVLDQITALNTTTSGMIQRTSEMLKDNSAEIQEQAASSTVGLPQLQAAFANIYATMDSIDTFKVKALDSMATTIGVLETEVEKSQAYLDRVQQARRRATRPGIARPRSPAAPSRLADSATRWALKSGWQGLATAPTGRRAPRPCPRRRPSRTSWPRSTGSNAMLRDGNAPAGGDLARGADRARPSTRRCPGSTSSAGQPAGVPVIATATDYLPEAVGGYLRLPREWADTPAGRRRQDLADGADRPARPARRRRWTRSSTRSTGPTPQALVAHGRFLEAEVRRSSSDGPAPT